MSLGADLTGITIHATVGEKAVANRADVSARVREEVVAWFDRLGDAVTFGDLTVHEAMEAANGLASGFDTGRMMAKFAVSVLSLRTHPPDEKGRYYGDEPLETFAKRVGIDVRALREGRRAANEQFRYDEKGRRLNDTAVMAAFADWVMEPVYDEGRDPEYRRPRSWRELQRTVVHSRTDETVHPPEDRANMIASDVENAVGDIATMREMVHKGEMDPDTYEGVRHAATAGLLEAAGRPLGPEPPPHEEPERPALALASVEEVYMTWLGTLACPFTLDTGKTALVQMSRNEPDFPASPFTHAPVRADLARKARRDPAAFAAEYGVTPASVAHQLLVRYLRSS